MKAGGGVFVLSDCPGLQLYWVWSSPSVSEEWMRGLSDGFVISPFLSIVRRLHAKCFTLHTGMIPKWQTIWNTVKNNNKKQIRKRRKRSSMCWRATGLHYRSLQGQNYRLKVYYLTASSWYVPYPTVSPQYVKEWVMGPCRWLIKPLLCGLMCICQWPDSQRSAMWRPVFPSLSTLKRADTARTFLWMQATNWLQKWTLSTWIGHVVVLGNYCMKSLSSHG